MIDSARKRAAIMNIHHDDLDSIHANVPSGSRRKEWLPGVYQQPPGPQVVVLDESSHAVFTAGRDHLCRADVADDSDVRALKELRALVKDLELVIVQRKDFDYHNFCTQTTRRVTRVDANDARKSADSHPQGSVECQPSWLASE